MGSSNDVQFDYGGVLRVYLARAIHHPRFISLSRGSLTIHEAPPLPLLSTLANAPSLVEITRVRTRAKIWIKAKVRVRVQARVKGFRLGRCSKLMMSLRGE